MELIDCAFPLVARRRDERRRQRRVRRRRTTRCSSAPGRARRAWSARSCSRRTARSSPRRARRSPPSAADDVRVLVVGNPANTNCLIAMNNAGSIPRERFTAMTRLDHNRAKAQLAAKTGVQVASVTQHDDLGQPLGHAVPRRVPRQGRRQAREPTCVDQDWIEKEFIPTVQQRGAAVIEARGASSAASAANAALDHVRDWALGTREGRLGEHGRAAPTAPTACPRDSSPASRARPRTACGRSSRASTSTSSRAAASTRRVGELGEERDAVAELGLI